VAGEQQPQIDIHKAFSRHFFFSFDETTTELRLDAEGLTETVLHLNLGYFFFPFDETTTELLFRHQHQDWRLKD
jgi:hypothetical protein